MEHHRQCKLSRQVDGRMEVITTWLPDKYAHIGKVLEIQVGPDKWQNGWSVCEVFARIKTEEAVARERDYKRIRGEDI